MFVSFDFEAKKLVLETFVRSKFQAKKQKDEPICLLVWPNLGWPGSAPANSGYESHDLLTRFDLAHGS